MNKEQLLTYLDAVCDAESAVQACNDAIALYEEKKQSISIPDRPREPQKRNAVYTAPDDLGKFLSEWIFSGTGIAPAIVAFFVFYLVLGGIGNMMGLGNDALGFIMILSAVLALLVPGIVVWKIDENASGERYTEAVQQAEREYRHAMSEHETRMTAYHKSCDLRSDSLNMLSSAIRNQEITRLEASNRLQQLYDMDVIYPAFRNMIAVYQIREYIRMGICDGLDGTSGAYSQYMLDVRAERICTSIADLKNTLVSAIQSLQGTIMRELRQTNDNLNAISMDINHQMQGISQQMQNMQQATSIQIDSYFNEANRQLTRMGENIAASAHNQYIEQRMRNVDLYLLQAPKSHQ